MGLITAGRALGHREDDRDKGGVGHQGHPVLPITAPARRHPGRRLNIQRTYKDVEIPFPAS